MHNWIRVVNEDIHCGRRHDWPFLLACGDTCNLQMHAPSTTGVSASGANLGTIGGDVKCVASLMAVDAITGTETGKEWVTHFVFEELLSMRTCTGAATHVISKCMPHPPPESVRVAHTSTQSVVISNVPPA